MTKGIYRYCAWSVLLLLCLSFSAFAQTGPNNLNVSGILYLPSGSPVTQSNVNFRLEIWDKASTCILYSEEHLAQDLSQSKGGFALAVGRGTSPANFLESSAALTSKIFENNGAVAGGWPNCASGTNLASGDERVIRVYYDLGGGFVAMTPDVPIATSAYALVADTLQGKSPEDLIQVKDNIATDLNQANVENVFSSTNYARLQQLLNPSAAITFGSQRLTNLANPSAAQDAATKSYTDTNLAGQTIDLVDVAPGFGGGKVLTWDSSANKWVAQAPAIAGNAGGDLSGTYPNPTIAALAVGTSKLADDAVTSAKINSTGIATNRLLVTDATTGATVTYANCANNEILKYVTGTGWQCATVASLSAVTSVAGKSGAVTLNAADITGLGTAAVRNIGTAATEVPELDAGGKLATSTIPLFAGDVTGAIGANIVTKLQGRELASTAPNLNEVLRWNGSRWEPQALTDNVGITALNGDVTASGTGLAAATINNGAVTTPKMFATPGANRLVATDATTGATLTPFVCSLNESILWTATGWTCATPSVSQWRNNGADIYYADGNVGIGTTSPQRSLHIVTDTFGSVEALTYNDVQDSQFVMRRSRGSQAAPSPVLSGDIMGTLYFGGQYSGGNTIGGGISAVAEEDWTGTGRGTYLSFLTKAAGGNALNSKMRLSSAGNLGIGITGPARKLHVNGPIRLEPAALPSSPAAGDLAFDSASGNSLKYHNGTNWVSLGTGSGDFLANGSVPMTGNLQLNNHWLSNDGGDEGVRIDNSGNIGIGLSSPTVPLDAKGGGDTIARFTSTGNDARIELAASGTGTPAYIGVNAGDLILNTDGAERMRFFPNSTSINGPLETSHVTVYPYGTNNWEQGQISLAELDGNGSDTFTILAPADLTASRRWTLPDSNGVSGNVLTTDGAGILSWTAASAGDFKANGSVPMTGNLQLNNHWLSNDGGDEGVRIDNNGNVGIGTTSPQNPLHVYAATGPKNIEMEVGSGNAGVYVKAGNNGWASFTTSSYDFYQLWSNTAAGNVLQLGNDGNLSLASYARAGASAPAGGLIVPGSVGIGTSSPSRSLDVNGAIHLAPSALPGTPAAGDIAVDSGASNALKYHNGTNWVSIGSGSGDFLANGSVPMTGNLQLNNHFLSNDGGDEGVFVAPNGNVGIGTTNPQLALDLGAGSLNMTASTGKIWWGYPAAATNLSADNSGVTFNVANSRSMVLSSPSSDFTFAPAQKSTSAQPGYALAVAGGLPCATCTDQNGGGLVLSGGGSRGTGTSAIQFLTAPAGTSGSGFNAAQARMVIQGNGNVGIGTTGPARLLEVNGAMRLAPAALPASPAAGDLAIDSGASNALKYHDGTNWVSIGSGSGDFLKNGSVAMTGNLQLNNHWLSGDGGNEGVFVTSAGDVGIGTSAPSSMLDVQGGGIARIGGSATPAYPAAGAGFEFAYDTDGNALTSTGGTGVSVFQSYDRSGGNWKDVRFRGNNLSFEANGPSVMYLTSGGNVGIGTTAPGAPLDVRKTFSATSGAEEYAIRATANYGATDTVPKQGLRADVTATVASGQLDYIWGVTSLNKMTGAGTLNQSLNYYARSDVNAGNLTSAIGFRFQDATGAGTLTNQYGIYIDNLTKGTTKNFAVYTAGTTPSYFGGNVGYGLTAPARRIHVNGAMRLEPSVLPGTPGAGDVAIDSSDANKLKYHDGTNWISIATGSGSQWGTNASDIYYNGGKVGIGTSTPDAVFNVTANTAAQAPNLGSLFHMTGADETSAAFTMDAFGSHFYDSPYITLRKAQGSAAAPADTAINDILGDMQMFGWQGGAWRQAAEISVNSLENWTATNRGVNISLTGIPVGNAGTVRFADFGNTITLGYTNARNKTSWTTSGATLLVNSGTITDTTGSGAIANRVSTTFVAPTYASTNPVTVATAANVYIAGAPVQGANTTLTKSLALQIASGDSAFQGKVGIGTTAPDMDLGISRNADADVGIRISNASNTSNAASGIYFNENGFDKGWVGVNDATSIFEGFANRMAVVDNSMSLGVSIIATSTHDIRMYTNGQNAVNERLRIDSAGKVGIGITTPARLLHVNGPIRLAPAALPASPAAGDIAIDSGASNALKYHNGTAWVSILSGGGGSQASASNFIFNSDSDNAGNDGGFLFQANGVTQASISRQGKILATGASAIDTAYASQSDSGTGLFFPSAGVIGFASASSQIATLSGNGLGLTKQLSVNVANANTYMSPDPGHALPLAATSQAILINNTAADSTGAFLRFRQNNTNTNQQEALIGGLATPGAGSFSPSIVFGQQSGAGSYAERMRIAPSGNVGIGTTAPSALLHVAGDARFDGQVVVDNNLFVGNSDFVEFEMEDSTASRFMIKNWMTPVLTIPTGTSTGAGNVGIGTTNPDQALTVTRASGGAWVKAHSTNNSAAGFEAVSDSGNRAYNSFYAGGAAADQKIKYLMNENGNIVLGKANDVWDTETHQLVILNNGNVGIGTTNPGARLQVESTDSGTNFVRLQNNNSSVARYPQYQVINFMGAAAAGSPQYTMFNSRGTSTSPAVLASGDVLGQIVFNGQATTSYGGTLSGADIYAVAEQTFTNTAAGSALVFETTRNGTDFTAESMRITNDGKVGIGASNPAAALDVNGAVLATGAMGSREATYSVAAGATYPGAGGVDMSAANVHTFSPGAAGACPTIKLDFTKMTAGLAYTIAFVGYNSGTCSIQDQTGATTNVKFYGGSAPALSGAQDVICSGVKVGTKLYVSCLNF